MKGLVKAMIRGQSVIEYAGASPLSHMMRSVWGQLSQTAELVPLKGQAAFPRKKLYWHPFQ
jgi:hypothetical protein